MDLACWDSPGHVSPVDGSNLAEAPQAGKRNSLNTPLNLNGVCNRVRPNSAYTQLDLVAVAVT